MLERGKVTRQNKHQVSARVDDEMYFKVKEFSKQNKLSQPETLRAILNFFFKNYD